MQYTDSEYYPPSIDEFHVGFNYEKLDHKETWIKYTCGKSFKDAYQMSDGDKFKIRVKCLDREDIESLGFIRKMEGMYQLNYYTLMVSAEGKNIHIVEEDRQSFGMGEYVKFDGTIKNKSELKRILKQIGI